MKLTEDNYFSTEAAKEYCSCSQLKQFMKCEAQAMAEIKGEYKKEVTESMLLGSYVDCKLLTPDKMPQFIESHPEIFKKNGELYAKFENGNVMVDRCKRDATFMNSLKGDKQTILTADLFGVPFRAKLDVFNDGQYITDLKTTGDFQRLEYDKVEKRSLNFAQYFKYDLQGAIYQEIVYKVTGKRLPFFISAVTTQKHPRIKVMHIDQQSMDEALEKARPFIENIPLLKSGEVEPVRCNECDYCADTEVLTDFVDWLGREYEEEE